MSPDDDNKSKAELSAEVRELRAELQDGKEAAGVMSEDLAKAQEGEERFRLMAEINSYGVWMSSPDGALMYASQTFLELLGIPMERAIGYGWMSRLHPEDVQRVKQEWLYCIQTGDLWDSEFRVLGPNEQHRTILVRGGPALDEDGRITSWVGMNLDITERKRDEAQVADAIVRAEQKRPQGPLREGDERCRILASGAKDYVTFMLDPEGRVVGWNEGAGRITGYEAGEMIGQNFSRFCAPEDVEAGRPQRALEIAAEKGRYEEEGWHFRKNGTRFCAKVVITALRDQSGRLRGFAKVITRDVTERRLAEQLVRDGEARMSGIVNTAVDGIITIDERGVIESVNPAALTAFGYAAEELIGQNIKKLMPEPDRIRHDEHIANFLKTGQKKIIGIGREVMGQRKDGSTFPIALAISEVRLAQRRIFTGIMRDITEQKRAETERADLLRREQQARADAEAANSHKDQFLAVLSHELRTPLTPVLGQVELLKREPDLSAGMRKGLDMISRNAQLEARLIEDLLDVTRLAAGQLRLDQEKVDVHETALEAWEIYRREAGVKELVVTVDLQASRHQVQGDPIRLQQVFWNLIGNAVKYTPVGGSVAIRSRNPDEGLLQVEVGDSGIGIDPDMMGRIFRPFEQAERTLSRRFGGLGLGLSISKALVEMHRGTLRAASAGKGMGATFTVELKVVAPVGTTPAAASAAGESQERSVGILLVEDNEDTLRVLSRLLQAFGHRVMTANSVKSALEMAAGHPFDLLISDIGLPDGTGWELMQTLRASRPVLGIAVSGFAQDEDIRKSKAVGFLEHLSKPIDPQRLASLIQQVALQLCP